MSSQTAESYDKPPVVNISDPRLSMIIKQLKAVGGFRCSILTPLCHEPPEWQVKYLRGPKGMFRLLCQKHAVIECVRNGFVMPPKPSEVN